MLNFIARAVLYCSCLLFAACTYQRNCNFVICKATCENRWNACTKVCRNNCPQCSIAAARSAAKNYAHYKHGQCIRGEIIALQLNSFRDPLQCRKTTCNCRADYQICMQACGGVIHKCLQYASLCS